MEKNWALFLVLVEVDGINWKQMATAKWIFFYLKKKGRTTRIFFGRTTFSKKNSTAKFDAGRSNCCDERRLHCTGFFFTEFTFFFGFFFGYRRVSRRRFSFFFLFAINCDRVLFFLFFFANLLFFKSHDLGGPAAYRIFFLPNFFFFCYFSFSSKTSFFLRDAIAGSDLFFPLIQRRKKKVKKK